MEGRAGHVEAVQAAIVQAQQVQDSAHAVKNRCPELLDLMIHATGEDPVSRSARAAMEAAVIITLKVDEVIALCSEAQARLREYGESF